MGADKNNLAYIIGVALGDGNLSNSNGRATRLRVSCDTKYPAIISGIISALQKLLPKNKVSIVKRQKNCIDISCYSNKLEAFLGWKANAGSKVKQKVMVPDWIKNNKTYIKYCLKGLFETDGSVYTDRKYKMANFVTIIPTLANDVVEIIEKISFRPNMQILKSMTKKTKYTIRISKNTEEFIKTINLDKS
jgi:DNA-binding transcriptional regulator WhiA